MAERLTRKQMADRYPNQWLGIRDIEYKGKEIESAEVIYINRTASELGLMSLKGEDVQPGYACLPHIPSNNRVDSRRLQRGPVFSGFC